MFIITNTKNEYLTNSNQWKPLADAPVEPPKNAKTFDDYDRAAKNSLLHYDPATELGYVGEFTDGEMTLHSTTW